MAAGLPKDPVKRLRSIVALFLRIGYATKRGVARRTRSRIADAGHIATVGGFSLRGGARPTSI